MALAAAARVRIVVKIMVVGGVGIDAEMLQGLVFWRKVVDRLVGGVVLRFGKCLCVVESWKWMCSLKRAGWPLFIPLDCWLRRIFRILQEYLGTVSDVGLSYRYILLVGGTQPWLIAGTTI